MEAETKTYDYVVIGAGSGGIASARRAALLGKKVALIERRVIGGTCVNVGCVPKKVMFTLANFMEEAEVMKGYHLDMGHPKLDFPSFKKARDAYIKVLNGLYKKGADNAGVDYYDKNGSFVSDKVVQVEGGPKVTADHVLIASGSTPQRDPCEGGELCISSDDIFAMEELPKSMIVIGGGYIGIEIA